MTPVDYAVAVGAGVLTGVVCAGPVGPINVAIMEEGKTRGQLYRLTDEGDSDFSTLDIGLNSRQVQALKENYLSLGATDADGDALFSAFSGDISQLMILPVQREKELIALILLGYRLAPVLDAEDSATARSYADRIAVALANAEWEERLYHQAHYDTLTGLPNRLSMLDRLERTLRQAERSDQPVRRFG